MADKDYSYITMVVDRSGSMFRIMNDAEGGINSFIEEQKKVPGRATLMLMDFDTASPNREVYKGDIAEFDSYSLEPRGGTPLLDAVGAAITRTADNIKAMPMHRRPAQVFMVICTDGQENSSIEYQKDTILSLIKEKEGLDWNFVFLATGAEAWDTANMFAGTRMHTNTVRGASTGAAYTSTMMYTASNVATARMGGKDIQWAANVNDDGEVETTDNSGA